MPYESIQLTRAVSDDVDDQAAMLKGWDQSYTQLEAGGFEATVHAAFLTHGSGIFRKTTNRKLHKIFAPPADSFAIAVQLAKSGLTLFQGQPTGAGDTLVLPGDRQFELICHGRFDVVVAVFPRADLASLLGAVHSLDTGARIIKGASGTRMGLRLAAALSELAASGSALELPAVQLRDEFLRRCSALLDEAEDQPCHRRNPTRRRTLRIFDEAKAFIKAALHREYVPTVMEIAGSVRVSARTLEYAFDHVVAVSPSRYLQCLRLCCARRDLKNGVEMSVTAVAMKWGFWHLGRFSIAYREMFGELPSQSHKSSKRLFAEIHTVPDDFRKTDSRDGSASLTYI